MKISVAIPAYNAAATLKATLDSVLCQTAPAAEILVMDDGSSDATSAILKSYEPRIRAFRQINGGASSARNALVAEARGDMIAFLDSDDLWHPRYLEVQRRLFDLYPTAVAYFVAHHNFTGLGVYEWKDPAASEEVVVEQLEPRNFLRRFRVAPGHFILSFCCVPRRVLDVMGCEPFRLRVAEDVYFFNLLPFLGTVVFASRPLLGVYRGRAGSLASNRLNCAEAEVNALELTEERYRRANLELLREFRSTLPSKRRAFAKMLLGVGRAAEARRQLRSSLTYSNDPLSFVKSLGLLSASYLPRLLQPQWPSIQRQ